MRTEEEETCITRVHAILNTLIRFNVINGDIVHFKLKKVVSLGDFMNYVEKHFPKYRHSNEEM